MFPYWVFKAMILNKVERFIDKVFPNKVLIT